MTTNVDRPTLRTSWATSARTAALVFAAVLIAAPLLAQRHAQPRSGGGGGGGGFSGGGHRSAGPSASAPSSRGGGGGGGNWDGGGHRPPGSGGGAPHRPPGFDNDHGHGHGHGHSYYYYPYYYSPYYYPYYGFSFGFGYGYPYYYGYPYGYYGYGYPYYYGYRPYYPPAYGYNYGYNYGEGAGYVPAGEATPYYDRASLGAVSVKVKPKSAQVYVDGNYVGAAGNFDGFPGYLWIPPGNHRIEVVQVGYANLTHEIEVGSGQVVELDWNLQRGESVRPEPPVNRYGTQGGERAPYPENDYRAAPPLEPRDPDSEARDERRFQSTDLGGLFLEVRPDDASVYLDGRFVGTGREVSTATAPLQLVPGEHRLQVIHPDYANQERTFAVGAGEEKRVEVYLGRGGAGV